MPGFQLEALDTRIKCVMIILNLEPKLDGVKKCFIKKYVEKTTKRVIQNQYKSICGLTSPWSKQPRDSNFGRLRQKT